jgi:hypothetical protein
MFHSMRETTIKILDEHHQTDLFPQPTMGKREQKVKKIQQFQQKVQKLIQS